MSAVSSTWAEETSRNLRVILCPQGRAGVVVGNKPSVTFSPCRPPTCHQCGCDVHSARGPRGSDTSRTTG